jgi:hypothetical protein
MLAGAGRRWTPSSERRHALGWRVDAEEQVEQSDSLPRLKPGDPEPGLSDEGACAADGGARTSTQSRRAGPMMNTQSLLVKSFLDGEAKELATKQARHHAVWRYWSVGQK